MSSRGPFLGKFRGVVTDNRDPEARGRVRAKVQDVLGDRESGWAIPASPYAGNGVGLFLIPPQNASVWIEFEHGDPQYPIWTGCFWARGEAPTAAAAAAPDIKVLKTDAATITLNDVKASAGITIETNDGKKITMDKTGIEITDGKWSVKLSSSAVSINNGALEIT
jgi:uncharacterized protein involved in type VI secretion and phage assembly